MEPEDPNTVIDLRSLNSSAGHVKYDAFWDICSRLLNETMGTAVDDRRHGQVVHLAQAISVRDFYEQAIKECPPGVAISSQEWLRLQFWPMSTHSKVSCHYTGRLNIKFCVQRRQWRLQHEDSHYAAAIFRYEWEFLLKFRDQSTFVCLDDKHRVKIGDPGEPLAATERGRRVIIPGNCSFEVSDHDFSKFSLIPSVSLLVDIPSEISGSWYCGGQLSILYQLIKELSPQTIITTHMLYHRSYWVCDFVVSLLLFVSKKWYTHASLVTSTPGH